MEHRPLVKFKVTGDIELETEIEDSKKQAAERNEEVRKRKW